MRLRRSRPSPWAFFKDFRRVRPYLRPQRALAFGSFSMVGVSALLTLLAPWPLALLIDTVLSNKPMPALLGFLDGFSRIELLWIAVVSGVLVTALQSAASVVDNYVNTKLEQRMVLDLRTDLFDHAQKLSLAYHDSKRTGNLMYQINNQASAVGAVTIAVPPLVQSVLTLLGMFIVVMRIDSTLALLSLTVVPFIYGSAGYYMRRIEPEVRHVRRLEGESLTIVHEAMAMLRVIVAFGRERHEHQRFRRQASQAVDARVRLTVKQTTFSLAVGLCTAVGTAIVLGFGAHRVLSDGMTAGELLVVMGYIASIYKPLEQISNTLSSFQQHFISLAGALDLLDTPIEIEEKPDAIELPQTAGAVTVRDVSFDYHGRKQTLVDVNFDVRPGERVGIVGPTGAGKSTLLNLIPRFYDPAAGAVLIDGHDVRDVTLTSLRGQISVVLQEPLLFSGSIADNIRYGRLEASDDEVFAAAEAANAHDFISALPQGYETELGERGAQISGGERQRIAVARAFLKDAPILILDEPTSSIDSRTEAVILEALERLAEGRTTFMVAHRLSTVLNSDLIVVINHGRVVELGKHHELLARSGLYRQLWDAQQGLRRGDATAALSPDALEEMTRAISEANESGRALHGPALAELSRSMAHARTEHDNTPGQWAVVEAIWSLLHDGSAAALTGLASDRTDPEHSALARQILADLGMPADLTSNEIRKAS
ncbi:MAG TPA: ABC transporter ATP-binding protein [Baekduia sp.]|nr:ABC transporter ATP-binding protein [Baekduia sp.]